MENFVSKPGSPLVLSFDCTHSVLYLMCYTQYVIRQCVLHGYTQGSSVAYTHPHMQGVLHTASKGAAVVVVVSVFQSYHYNVRGVGEEEPLH